jgi:hypothetical protein
MEFKDQKKINTVTTLSIEQQWYDRTTLPWLGVTNQYYAQHDVHRDETGK